jgi:predicted dehydrogenase
MNRRTFLTVTLTIAFAATSQAADDGKPIRLGIIGLDTSHAVAFAKELNSDKAAADIANCRVVAAYPKGSPDIESSTKRVPGYTEEVKKLGVEIVDSIEALLTKVDGVLLETNDGRPHLEQILPCLKAGKPVFIDKPIAGSLADAIAIFELAKKHKVQVWSSSSLRYAEGAQAIRNGKVGDVLGADAWSPCSLEATHPDLFWYGIHGVETLFTCMGPGCETVVRVATKDTDLVVGTWKDGRVGTFRGIRHKGATYGGTAFGSKGVSVVGPFGGYRPLIVEIVAFFRSGKPPVSAEETIDIYAFMEAADESKRQGGVPVKVSDVMKKAGAEAAKKIEGR